MHTITFRAPRSRTAAALLAGLFAGLFLAAGARPVFGQSAQGLAHRARLSADLADHLAAGSPAIDVIVHGTKAEVDALAARYNLKVKKYLRNGQNAVLRMSAGQLAALRQDPDVDHLSNDIQYRSSADAVAESIGADQLWAGSGALAPLSGRGIGVAVIDSGMDLKHPALRGRVRATVDFTGGDGGDGFGHGTHVAATIAGLPGAEADTAGYRGIAPGAHLVNLRVLGDDGSGYASSVVDAIDYAIDHRKEYDIRVINLSLGAPVMQPYRDDPVGEAVDRAVAKGIVVVAAAGNFGQTKDGRIQFGGITSPGNHPQALTVGALDTKGTAIRSDDVVAAYSSRGPTMYDLVLKPDLVAPGSRVVSAAAADSYLAGRYPERVVAGTGPGRYMQLSGTSMAAGVVSGAVALLLERAPQLKPRDAKAVLQLSSSFMREAGLVTGGAGSLNALEAISVTTRDRASLLSHQVIAGEPVEPSGVAYITDAVHKRSKYFGSFALDTIVWGGTIVRGSTIVWGGSAFDGDTIVWGGMVSSDTIVWGGSADTIVWGGTIDTIVWGGYVGDTIVWGGNAFE